MRSTAEIGVFKITSEGSSAANVRRIEAVTGPEAVALLRRHDALLREAAARAAHVARARCRRRSATCSEQAKRAAQGRAVQRRASTSTRWPGARPSVAAREVLSPTSSRSRDAKALLDAADRVKGKLGDAAIVLGAVADGRVHLVAAVAPALVERGVKAGDVVKAPRRSSAAAAAGATRWPRPAGAIPRSSPTRSRPRARPSKPRSPSDRRPSSR